MKRSGAAALAIIGALVFGALPATASQLRPTAPQMVWAHSRAVAYWHVAQPPCGRVHLVLNMVLAPPEAGHAWPDSCTVGLDSKHDWRDFPELLCLVYMHEFGHLVLGLNYFAASNPRDPMHSPDPNSIMYATVPTTHRAIASVGCTPPRRLRT